MSYEFYKNYYDIGDGKMEYIQDTYMRKLLTDAWKATTLTNNWDFVYQDISNFTLESDKRNCEILQKMGQINPFYLQNNHKYHYRILMRYMHYLIRNGEEQFENFVKSLSV